MDENLNILIKQTTQSIEHDKGMAAMFASSADEKQKLLSALLVAREEIEEKEQLYQEERAARERAEAALEKERQRPLYTCNVTLPDSQDNESFYPHKNKYVDVVEWLTQQKQKGVDYYAAAGYNRSEMCRKLSKIFGWEVDQNSLRKAGF